MSKPSKEKNAGARAARASALSHARSRIRQIKKRLETLAGVAATYEKGKMDAFQDVVAYELSRAKVTAKRPGGLGAK